MRVMHHDLPVPARRSTGHCAERGLHMLASPASDTAELDVDCFDEVAATQWESICHAWQQPGKSTAATWQEHGKIMARAWQEHEQEHGAMREEKHGKGMTGG